MTLSAPGGKRGAGEDACGLSPPDLARRESPGGDLLDHAKSHRPLLRCAAHVLAPGGVAVHRGVGAGRDIERDDDVFRQDGAEGVIERNAKGGLSRGMAEDFEGGVASAQARHIVNALSHARAASSWSQIVSLNRRTGHSASSFPSSVTIAIH